MYKCLSFRVIDYILSFILLEFNRYEDTYYRFKNDRFRKIWRYKSIIINMKNICQIPENIKLHALVIYGYNTISEIPENIKIHTLEIRGNNTIGEIPENINIHTLIIS